MIWAKVTIDKALKTSNTGWCATELLNFSPWSLDYMHADSLPAMKPLWAAVQNDCEAHKRVLFVYVDSKQY